MGRSSLKALFKTHMANDSNMSRDCGLYCKKALERFKRPLEVMYFCSKKYQNSICSDLKRSLKRFIRLVFYGQSISQLIRENVLSPC